MALEILDSSVGLCIGTDTMSYIENMDRYIEISFMGPDRYIDLHTLSHVKNMHVIAVVGYFALWNLHCVHILEQYTIHCIIYYILYTL